MNDLLDADIETAAAALRDGAVSARALTEAALTRVGKIDGRLRAFLHVERDVALERADLLDRARKAGAPLGPLHGVPLARKDLFDRAGEIATCGAARWAKRRARETATCLARLDAAGAIDLGALNMSEYAFHPHGLNSVTEPARNPWDLARTAGGSSGGSAAALAARLIFGSMGSDSGGSIRFPAALCGVVGLLPTRGRVSRQGMMRSSPSLDAAGPLARTVRDCAALFTVVAGSDPVDPTTVKRTFAMRDASWRRSLRNRRIVIPKDKLLETLSPAVRSAFDAAVRIFSGEGVNIAAIDLPDWDALNAITAIVFASEVAATHQRSLAADPDAYSPEVRERMAAGLLYPASDYLDALRLRARLTCAFVETVFAGAEVLLLPSAADVAPRLDEVLPGAARARYDAGAYTLATAADPGRFTRAFNYLGLPALALPAGFSPDGLPVGIQIAGPPFAEATLFEFGHAFQRVTDHHLRAPALATNDATIIWRLYAPKTPLGGI